MAKASKKSLIIDTVSLLSSFTGIARYTYENSKIIKNQQKYDLFFNYLYPSKKLFTNSSAKNSAKTIRNFLIKNPYLKKYSRKLINSFNLLYPKTYDIYWQPNNIFNPNIKAKKYILTLHDFSFLHYPLSHPKERLEYISKNLPKTIKKADHIITGSNYTKNEIIKYLSVKESNITVIYHAVDHQLFKPYSKEILNSTKIRYNLPEKFILFVGSIEPRKNLTTLLKAYDKLHTSLKKEYPLILVGSKGWENQAIFEDIGSLEYIRYLGYIEDFALPHIYNLASIFVYPSLYEGFGIPPLESMACKTPVIVSSSSSMPEICQDCALYIDPEDVNDIKKKLTTLIKDEKLQKYLIQKGIKRAKEFTWEKSAQKHMEIFDLSFS